MKIGIALLLSLVSTAASAEWWRADLESGQDAIGLVIVVCAGLAWFWVRDEFRRGADAGMAALVMTCAIAVAALYFQWVRVILCALTLYFLVYGLIRRR